jgi:predicted permease
VKKIFISFSLLTVFILPMLVLAQNVNFGYVDTAFNSGRLLLNRIVIFLISLAVVWFIWNVIKYSMSSEEDDKQKAKSQMIHGIIAIAVMVSVWGIVSLLRNAFGVENNNQLPSNINNMIPGSTASGNGLYGSAAGDTNPLQ